MRKFLFATISALALSACAAGALPDFTARDAALDALPLEPIIGGFGGSVAPVNGLSSIIPASAFCDAVKKAFPALETVAR